MRISKCTSLFLAMLILVSNVGLAFNVHYCGGEIAGISSSYSVSENASANASPERGCCTAKAKEGKTCCDEKIIKLKGKSDVVVKTFSFQIAAPFVIQNWNPIVFGTPSKIASPQTSAYYCDAHAPPLYQLYSQYVFYA